jgi:cyclase
MSNPPRIIPVLLLSDSGVVKTTRFKDPRYVGDPINALRVFNDKEVDEVVIVDIDAWKERRGPNFERVAELAGECFMPLGYGGGITTLDQIRTLFRCGVEKVLLNSALYTHPELVRAAADIAGSQSVVAAIDVKKNWLGHPRVYVAGGTIDTGADPVQWAKLAAQRGAGEIVIQSIDRDGGQGGYDLELIRQVALAVEVPVVALGGARGLPDMVDAMKAGAGGVAAGSFFVFHGKHRAVLITYPTADQVRAAFTAKQSA